MRLALQMIMADPTQPSETVLFDRSAPTSSSPTSSPAINQRVDPSDPLIDNQHPTSVSPQPPLTQPNSIPNQLIQPQPLPTNDQANSMNPSDSVPNDLVGFNQNSGEVIILHQPVSLLIVRLISISLFYYLVLWLVHRVIVALLGVFPELVPGYPANDFIGSPLLFWGSILFILIVIGIILRWWTIFFQISSSEVVAHSGIIIKQAKVLKRIGINVRQIEIRRNLLGMLLNYVTIEIGSEVMGGVSMTISDRPESLQMMTDALKPGEVLQTKKLF